MHSFKKKERKKLDLNTPICGSNLSDRTHDMIIVGLLINKSIIMTSDHHCENYSNERKSGFLCGPFFVKGEPKTFLSLTAMPSYHRRNNSNNNKREFVYSVHIC